MSMNPYGNSQVVYQAEPAHVDTVKTIKEKLHGICKERLMHKHVLLKTLEGHEYEGVIVFIDGDLLYLSLAEDEQLNRSDYWRYGYPFGPGFGPSVNPGSAILPLVLYNLLAITLLYT